MDLEGRHAMDNIQIREGLEGVVAATTRLSSVDGEAGVLLLAGFPVEEIAPRASFEEMTWLLWNGSSVKILSIFIPPLQWITRVRILSRCAQGQSNIERCGGVTSKCTPTVVWLF